jgi:hypothetical protein
MFDEVDQLVEIDKREKKEKATELLTADWSQSEVGESCWDGVKVEELSATAAAAQQQVTSQSILIQTSKTPARDGQ